MVQATAYAGIPFNPPLPTRYVPIRRESDRARVRSRAAAKIGPAVRSSDFLLPIAGAVALSVVAAFALLYFRESLAGLGAWGYLGVFVAELGNSASILIPTPGPAYALSMSVILNPVYLALIGGVGAALGELTGYYVGVKGRRIVEGGRLFERFRALTGRWTGGALFVFAIMPLPFDIAGIWAGTVRYPLWRFVLYAMPGKFLKVLLVALMGYYGVNWLLGPVG